MSHVVSKELFSYIEKRWGIVNPERDIDLHLREILPCINSIDGVMSVWSCSGHTLQEDDAPLPENFNPAQHRSRSYIALVIREGSEHLIDQLVKWMGQSDITQYRPRFKIKLEFSHLNLRGLTRNEADGNTWYPVICIEVVYNPYLDLERVTYKKILGSALDYLSNKV